jgi:hypothetical protein
MMGVRIPPGTPKENTMNNVSIVAESISTIEVADTELVGGFVSGLNIVCTADDIVERACRMLKSKSTVTAPLTQEAVNPEGGPA